MQTAKFSFMDTKWFYLIIMQAKGQRAHVKSHSNQLQTISLLKQSVQTTKYYELYSMKSSITVSDSKYFSQK